jgi:hypothetical protein
MYAALPKGKAGMRSSNSFEELKEIFVTKFPLF